MTVKRRAKGKGGRSQRQRDDALTVEEWRRLKSGDKSVTLTRRGDDAKKTNKGKSR
jgi:hypothetical protein